MVFKPTQNRVEFLLKFVSWTQVLLLMTSVSYARENRLQLPSSQELKKLENPETEMKFEKSQTTVVGHIRIESMQYLTALEEAPQLTNSNLLSARISAFRDRELFDFAADVSGGTYFVEGQNHLVVHELFSTLKPSQNIRAFAGRKKAQWSELDRRWQLGLWQPYFSMDLLRPEDQGLTGLFYQYRKADFEFLAFASPIYVPSMGPQVREENGSLVSDNRWYRAPSSDYNFNNRINSITYDLDIPEIARLVTQESLGASLRAGDRLKGTWVQAAAGYKPVNDMPLKRKVFKAVSEDNVDVTVSPEVTHHGIFSLDIGHSYDRVRLAVSYLEDRPYGNNPDEDWSVQKLDAIQAYSAAIDFDVENFLSKSFLVQLGYLKVQGGGITDITSDGSPDDITLFDQRLRYTDAISVAVEGQLSTIYRKPLVSKVKWLYDYDQQGSILSTEFLYYPNQKWAFVMGADILGVQSDEDLTSGFINSYRANDRVYGGMTYVF